MSLIDSTGADENSLLKYFLSLTSSRSIVSTPNVLDLMGAMWFLHHLKIWKSLGNNLWAIKKIIFVREPYILKVNWYRGYLNPLSFCINKIWFESRKYFCTTKAVFPFKLMKANIPVPKQSKFLNYSSFKSQQILKVQKYHTWHLLDEGL